MKNQKDIVEMTSLTLPNLPYFATCDIPAGLGVLASEQQKLLARWITHQRQSNGGPPSPMKAAETGKMLTVEEAAKVLGVGKDWVYANGKKLGAFRISHRKIRIPETKLQRYLAMRRSSGGQ